MNQPLPKPNVSSASSIFDYGKWRAGFLQSILIGAAILGFVSLAANFLTGAATSDLITYSAAFVILLLVTLIPLPYSIKASVFLALIYALAISGFLDTGLWGDSRVFLLALVIVASLLFSPLAGLIVTGIGTLTTALFGWLILTSQYQVASSTIPVGAFADWLTGTLTDILLAVVVIIGLRLIQREFEHARKQAGSSISRFQEESRDIESRMEERTAQLAQTSELLRSTSFIVRNTAELQNVPTLLERTVQLASELLRYDHVAIYLFDERKKVAFLQAASSDIGKKMVEGGFHIEASARNAIGYVSMQYKPYTFTDDDAGNKADLNSEGKLDSTHTEIIMPLMVRGKIIGVVDFQSKESHARLQDEIDILQVMADQLAISIDNAQLVNETQAFTRELESLTVQQTGNIWREYFLNRTLAYQYTPSETKPTPPGFVNTKKGDQMQVPLRLRGQNIGAITFQGKEKSKWTENERDLVEKVADQVALALDNSRLIEETRRQAAQQQTVSEISSHLNRFLDIDLLLQTAARELGSLPEIAEVSVSIGETNAPEQSRVRTDAKKD